MGWSPSASGASTTGPPSAAWSAPQAVEPGLAGALACVSPGHCLVGDGTGHLIAFGRNNPVSPAPAPEGLAGIAGLSCSAGGTCAAIDTAGHLATEPDPGAPWSPATMVGTGSAVTAFTCPAAGSCLFGNVAGDLGVVTTSGPTTSGKIRRVFVTGGVTSISCGSPRWCLAADAAGDVATYDGRSWSGPRATSNGSIPSLSCPAPRFCLAVTSRGVARFDGRSWSTFAYLAGKGVATTVTCATRTRCLVGQDAGLIATYDGRRWSRSVPITPAADRAASVTRIACPTTTICAALFVLGGGGSAASYVSTTAG